MNNLEEFSKEDLIRVYKRTLIDVEDLRNQLSKAKKEIKELKSTFTNFEQERTFTPSSTKRFSIR